MRMKKIIKEMQNRQDFGNKSFKRKIKKTARHKEFLGAGNGSFTSAICGE